MFAGVNNRLRSFVYCGGGTDCAARGAADVRPGVRDSFRVGKAGFDCRKIKKWSRGFKIGGRWVQSLCRASCSG